jgi:hypothetical protein
MTILRNGFPLLLALGLALAGCGGDAGTTVAPQSTYTTTNPYTDTFYQAPSNPTTGIPPGSPFPYEPIASQSIPVTTPPTPSKTGVEVQLLSKELPGMFSWERCEAKITVTNHEATPQRGFLIVSFTLKGSEVELQYRTLSLPVQGSQTFLMKSTVRADDVRLDYRTKLL